MTYSVLIFWQGLKTECWVQSPCAKQRYNETNYPSTERISICFRVSPVSVHTFLSGLSCLRWAEVLDLYHTQAKHVLQEVHVFYTYLSAYRKEMKKCGYSQLLKGKVVKLFIRITGKGQELEAERGETSYSSWAWHCACDSPFI